jgi:O-antigen/teichoic acid export membrane protein
MLVKVAGMIIGLLVSVFLGHALGAEGLGIINFANKLGMILLILTMFGFQNVVIKFIAIAKTKEIDKDIATTLKTSLIFNGVLSLVIASIASLVLPLILAMWSGSQDLYIPLLITFVMLIPQTISRVYGSALNGYGKIWQANLVNQTLSIILVGLGLVIYKLLNITYTPISVLLLYAVSRVLLAFLVIALWRQTFKTEVKGQVNFKPMFQMAKPMLLVTGTAVIASNADAIMLGLLGTLKDVGIYSVAASLALLTSLFLQVTNAAISPKLASLFSASKIDEMSLMVKRVTKGLSLVAISSVILFIVLGKWLLGFWGVEFQDAYWVLLVLSIGQFFNIATGCSGLLLVMCGFEKLHGIISLTTTVLNLLLNYLFIINYGIVGAAIATAISIIFENIMKVLLVKKKIGITIFSQF